MFCFLWFNYFLYTGNFFLFESTCYIYKMHYYYFCFCSSPAAVLLTCLEDIDQNQSSYCSSCIPKIHTIVLFLIFLDNKKLEIVWIKITFSNAFYKIFHCPISTIPKVMASEQAASSHPKHLKVSCRKRG